MIDPEIDWDDAVDVICVGTAPALAAYGKICAAAGLDVLAVGFPPAGPDDGTAAYLAAMTVDLHDLPAQDRAVRAATGPAPPGRGRRETLEPFVGERLRQWSAECLADGPAVLVTDVPDHVLRPMRPDGGEVIVAAAVPHGEAVAAEGDSVMASMIHEWGRIAGARIDGPSGSRLVRSEHGLALPVGPGGAAVPAAPLALVSRPAGRFARLQTLAAGDD